MRFLCQKWILKGTATWKGGTELSTFSLKAKTSYKLSPPPMFAGKKVTVYLKTSSRFSSIMHKHVVFVWLQKIAMLELKKILETKSQCKNEYRRHGKWFLRTCHFNKWTLVCKLDNERERKKQHSIWMGEEDLSIGNLGGEAVPISFELNFK